MPRATVIVGLAALASAALFLSLTSGTLSLAVHLAQLPLLLVGFTSGLLGLGLAALLAASVVALVSGAFAALVYALVEIGPCLLIVRFALLSRPLASGGREWYPIGSILGCLTIYVLGLTSLVLYWLQMRTGTLESVFGEAIARVAPAMLGDEMSGPVIERLSGLLPVLPGIAAVTLLVISMVNGMLALTIASSQSGGPRPKERMADLRLPGWCMPLLILLVLAAMVSDGDAAYYARSAALVAAVPFLVVGLALVHCLVARLPARLPALVAVYLLLLGFSLVTAPMLAAMGLIEDRAHLRRHLT